MRFAIAVGLSIACALSAMASPASEKSWLASLDANDDHAISRQEAANAQVDVFHQMDRNRDDTLGRDEFSANQPMPDKHANRDKSVQRARARALDQRFSNLDTDNSGAISLAEYQSAMTPYFDRLDANGDGVIDASELRRAYTKDNSVGSPGNKKRQEYSEREE